MEDRIRTLETSAQRHDGILAMLVENDRHRVEIAQENAVTMARMADAMDRLKETLLANRERSEERLNERFLHATGLVNEQEKRFGDITRRLDGIEKSQEEHSTTQGEQTNFIRNFKWAVGVLYALILVAASAVVTHAVNTWLGAKP